MNGQSLLGATHQEAVNILRNAGDEIRLLVCDGFNPSALPSEGKIIQDLLHAFSDFDQMNTTCGSLAFPISWFRGLSVELNEIIYLVVKNEMFKTLKCIFVVLS